MQVTERLSEPIAIVTYRETSATHAPVFELVVAVVAVVAASLVALETIGAQTATKQTATK